MSNQSITQFIVQYPPEKLTSPSLLSTHLLKLLTLLSQCAPFYQYLLYKHLLTIPSMIAYNRNDCIRIMEHMRKESLSRESREIATRVLKILHERFFPHQDANTSDTSGMNKNGINNYKENVVGNLPSSLENESKSDRDPLDSISDMQYKVGKDMISAIHMIGSHEKIDHSFGEKKTNAAIGYTEELSCQTPEEIESLLKELQSHSHGTPSLAEAITMQINDRQKLEILETILKMLLTSDTSFKNCIIQDSSFLNFCEMLYFHKNPKFVEVSMRIMMKVFKYYSIVNEATFVSQTPSANEEQMRDIAEPTTFKITKQNLELVPQALVVSITNFINDKKTLIKLCKIACQFVKYFARVCGNGYIIHIKLCKLLGKSELTFGSLKIISTCILKLAPFDNLSFSMFSEPLKEFFDNICSNNGIQSQRGGIVIQNVLSALILKIAKLGSEPSQDLMWIKEIITSICKQGESWTLYKVSQVAMENGLFDLAQHSLSRIIDHSTSEKTFYWLLHLKQWCEAELCTSFVQSPDTCKLSSQQLLFINARSSLFMSPSIHREHSFQKYILQIRLSFSEILEKIQLLQQRLTFPTHVYKMISMDIVARKFQQILLDIRTSLDNLVVFSQNVCYSFLTIDKSSVAKLQSFCDLCIKLKVFLGCLLQGEPYLQETVSLIQQDSLAISDFNEVKRLIHHILVRLEDNPTASLKDRIIALKEVMQQCLLSPFQIPNYYFRVSKSFHIDLEFRIGNKPREPFEVVTIDNDAVPIRVFGQVKYTNSNEKNKKNGKYARIIFRCRSQDEEVGTNIVKSKCEMDSFQAECLLHLPTDRNRFIITIETQIIDVESNIWDFVLSEEPCAVRLERLV